MQRTDSLKKDPDSEKDRRQEEKGKTEDEMVGWCHRLNGHEFEKISGDREGQGSLACCSPQDHKESDTTERLNNKTEVQTRGGHCILWEEGGGASIALKGHTAVTVHLPDSRDAQTG